MTHFFGIVLATAITLVVFSRAFQTTPLFRWTSHLLLGAGAGYVAAIVLRQVLLPALSPASFGASGAILIAGSAALFTLLLILRFAPWPAVRPWGLLPVGMVAGVGAALALAGALRGVLLPQLRAVSQLHFTPDNPILDVLLVVIATFTALGVLLYFLPNSSDDAPDNILIESWQWWGYLALMLALGALLASTAGARITLLIDRVQYLLRLWGLG